MRLLRQDGIEHERRNDDRDDDDAENDAGDPRPLLPARVFHAPKLRPGRACVSLKKLLRWTAGHLPARATTRRAVRKRRRPSDRVADAAKRAARAPRAASGMPGSA